ncbi:MAG: hypothetical protein J2P24_00280 [Streptosporangiales bacterium]|nr:hypothetical protein [Streptosporangiales bacterium]
MPDITFRGGRLAPHPADTHPRIRFRVALTGELPPLPKVIDYAARIKDWPMYGNDQWGDCVWAMIGHMIESVTAYAGDPVKPTEAALLKGYADVTGFDPDDPSTDQGTVIQDALDYWRKTGIEMPDGSRHRILGFAQVDHGNAREMDYALDLFGAVAVGVNFPSSAMDQFNAGQPWDYIPGSPVEGGHAVHKVSSDTTTELGQVVTWGRVQPVTETWAMQYVEETWAVALPELVDDDFPLKANAAALNSAFEEVTGHPGPFPVDASR